jgi:ribonuclease HI
MSPERSTGYGYVVYRAGEVITQESYRLREAEVVDAEAYGALAGLRAALNGRPQGSAIFVCLDNTSVVDALMNRPMDSSQGVYLCFQDLVKRHGGISVRWCPGHTEIPGNEHADRLAKAGTRLPEPPDGLATLAFVRRAARASTGQAFCAWWTTAQPAVYEPLELNIQLNPGPELALSRAELRLLLAARSGHGDFAAYHDRFNHQTSSRHCPCGRRTAPTHVFYCRKIPTRYRFQALSSDITTYTALGTRFDLFLKLIRWSQHYTSICPNFRTVASVTSSNNHSPLTLSL